MQTRLSAEFASTSKGGDAAALLKSCVHCGFCTATCPTYQLLGDELDGPRGRLSLIQQVLEGQTPTSRTQLHLDRCLVCRACETTCPSGVQYGRVLDIGREIVEAKVPRSLPERLWRKLLAATLTGPLFAPLLQLGRALRPVLPLGLSARIPQRSPRGEWPTAHHPRRMLLLAGCVQPALSPNTNAATARILDHLGIEVRVVAEAGCCGAIRHHLIDSQGALEDMRRNIDAWWPHVEAGVEAIVSSASGCGAMLLEYGYQLRNDPLYADRAARIAALVRDPVQVLQGFAAELRSQLRSEVPQRVAFQSPCSLQHALGLRGAVERLLTALGAELVQVADAGSCCGSAGTYSLLQPQISGQLGRAKISALTAARPEIILSANIGCITHLGACSNVPVQHWIEWLDERLGRVTGISDASKR